MQPLRWNTLEEAAAWLAAETGEEWTARRVLDACIKRGIRLQIWLDKGTDGPPELFGDRTEGFMAPLVFAGDDQRLAFTGDGMLTMTRAPDGRLVRFDPGLPFSVDDIRIKDDALLSLTTWLASAAPTAPAPELDKVRTPRGYRWREIIDAPWPKQQGFDLAAALSNKIPQWLDNETAIIRRGTAPEPTLWNPAGIAICMATDAPRRKWRMQSKAFDNVIRSHFADFLEEWEKFLSER